MPGALLLYPPPLPPLVSNEQFCPKKIRSERECSLDMLFGVCDNIAKRPKDIPMHETRSPHDIGDGECKWNFTALRGANGFS